MKFTNIGNLLLIGVLLAVSAVGCKRKTQNPTPLPGYEAGPVGNKGNTAGPVLPPPTNPNLNPINTRPDPGFTQPPTLPPVETPIRTTTTLPPPEPPAVPTSSSGFALTNDFSNWTQDRDRFKNETVYFDFDKSVVKASEIGKVQTVATALKGMPGKAVRIEGHCDERGTEEYNRALGERRALSVREALIKEGIPANMIDTVTFGEDRPVDRGHNEAAWRKNRRGEFILLTAPGSN